ncbi:TIGR03086 family metal-binding protein [Lentzea sp. HUAS12]|uniref:TIGR03086 family metal-binding protein n=1 Tax=Lentzea sp. HUAS12 TaxID=2951806 RepID=UPI003531DF4A
MFDLTPAAGRLADVVRAVGDDDLDAPTPCPDYTVGDLLDHVHGLAVAFTMAARKTPLEGTASGDASRLPDDFRESIPARLDELARAWRAHEAWEGMTRAGGVDLPGEVAAAVALDEIVLHGWDLAKATGQPFEVEEGLL